MEGEEDVVTADDVAALNRAAVDRSAVLARIAGAALVAVGAIATLSWLWLAVRTQQLLDDSAFVRVDTEISATGPTPSAKDRLDAFTTGVGNLVLGALAIGAGAGTRVLADYAQARAGGSITGFQVGDRFTEAGDEPEPKADS